MKHIIDRFKITKNGTYDDIMEEIVVFPNELYWLEKTNALNALIAVGVLYTRIEPPEVRGYEIDESWDYGKKRDELENNFADCLKEAEEVVKDYGKKLKYLSTMQDEYYSMNKIIANHLRGVFYTGSLNANEANLISNTALIFCKRYWNGINGWEN